MKPSTHLARRPRLSMTTWLLGGTLLLAAVPGCKVEREQNFEFLPMLNHMMFSSAAETNTANKVFKNGMTNQLPPEGTIPRGFQPLHFTADEAGREQAGRELKNPYDPTPDNLARGKEKFNTFCTPCHGPIGAGDGLVTKRGMPGFPINTGAPTGYPDGKIFHLTSFGRNNMPSYATQVSQEDRWKIVLHLRELQKAAQTAAGQPQ